MERFNEACNFASEVAKKETEIIHAWLKKRKKEINCC
jgi:hypothetical protein